MPLDRKNCRRIYVDRQASVVEGRGEITWNWLADWKTPRRHTHKVTKSGAKCVIQVGGTKRPKMGSITIARPVK